MNVRSSLFLAIALAFGAQAALAADCNIDSDYDVRFGKDAITFSRDDGDPREVVMHDGSLRIDGTEAKLSAADREQVRAFEREARALVPEIRGITLDAVDIAFTAMREVAEGLAPERESLRTALQDTHAEILAALDQSGDTFTIDEEAVEASIERLVGKFTPTLVGEITSAAISAALSGDEKTVHDLEARADGLEATIEARIKPRADALEARADALCPRIARLDAIDDALAWRNDAGAPLDLLRTH